MLAISGCGLIVVVVVVVVLRYMKLWLISQRSMHLQKMRLLKNLSLQRSKTIV